MLFNIKQSIRPPFELVDSQQIIDLIGDQDVEEFLGANSDFQIYDGLNPDMPETEIVQYTVDFMLDNAEKFQKGHKAYMVEFQRVFYVFVTKSLDDLIQRISKST